jgi:N-acetylmuramoyl-L-alanine amidase.
MAFKIITCPKWGAVKPKGQIVTIGKSARIIIHHTAGHVAQVENPQSTSVEECIRYARAIQRFHMQGNGWNDSGHNFLVCRNGVVLQGRWLTVSAIQAGHMVMSAHCPGQNDQIGIEHEHQGTEAMTTKQRESSAKLIAWISMHYDRKAPLPLAPHNKYFATACPANLISEIPNLSRMAKAYMDGGDL